jgi:hypothetical protein
MPEHLAGAPGSRQDAGHGHHGGPYSPNSASTRGLAHGEFFTQDGRLVGSVTQEVLIRRR